MQKSHPGQIHSIRSSSYPPLFSSILLTAPLFSCREANKNETKHLQSFPCPKIRPSFFLSLETSYEIYCSQIIICRDLRLNCLLVWVDLNIRNLLLLPLFLFCDSFEHVACLFNGFDLAKDISNSFRICNRSHRTFFPQGETIILIITR